MEDLLPYVVAWVLSGLIAGVIADGKGHGFGSWFVVGGLLGPLGVLLILLTSRTPEAEAKRQAEVDAARRRLADS